MRVESPTNQQILESWQRNTIPIYHFSDPEMTGKPLDIEIPDGGSSVIEPWVRLLPQNLPRLVDEVLIGNPESSAIFFDYLHTMLRRFLSYKARDEAEDLAQAASLRISNVLPDFENRGERTFSQSFHSFCYAVARNSLFDFFDDQRRRPQTIELQDWTQKPEEEEVSEPQTKSWEDLEDSEYFNQQDEQSAPTWDMFWDRVTGLLPENQWQIVDRMKGEIPSLQIMKDLGITRLTYMRDIKDARQAIVDNLLSPAGLKTTDSLEFSQLSTDLLKEAARRGQLDAIKILGRWYITEPAFKMLLWKRDHPGGVLMYSVPHISNHPISIEREDQVRRLAAEGLTVDEMAAEIKKHPNVVKRALARLRKKGEKIKVTRPPTSQNIPKDYSLFDARVEALRNSGVKNEDIAYSLRVSIASVTRSIDRSLKTKKITKRKPGGDRKRLPIEIS